MAVADRKVGTEALGIPVSDVARSLPPAAGLRRDDHRGGVRKRTITGYAALTVALLACPCHLPLTLGVAAALLGGSTVAALLTENAAIFATAAVIFVVSLGLAYRLLWSRDAAAVR